MAPPREAGATACGSPEDVGSEIVALPRDYPGCARGWARGALLPAPIRAPLSWTWYSSRPSWTRGDPRGSRRRASRRSTLPFRRRHRPSEVEPCPSWWGETGDLRTGQTALCLHGEKHRPHRHERCRIAKACNQVVMLTTLQGLAEAFTLRIKRDWIPSGCTSRSRGAAQCRILEVLGADSDARPPGSRRVSTTRISRLSNEAHSSGMALPGPPLLRRRSTPSSAAGAGTQDSSQLWEVIEGMSAPA